MLLLKLFSKNFVLGGSSLHFSFFPLQPLQLAYNWKIVISPGLTSKTLIGSLNAWGSYELLPILSIVRLTLQNKENWTQRSSPSSDLASSSFPVSFVFLSLFSKKRGGEEIRMLLFRTGTAIACANRVFLSLSLAASVVLPVSGSPPFCPAPLSGD